MNTVIPVEINLGKKKEREVLRGISTQIHAAILMREAEQKKKIKKGKRCN